MKPNISLPGLRLENVENISKVNNYIHMYSRDIQASTIEDIDTAFDLFDGNVVKFIQLGVELIKHTVRRNMIAMSGSVISRMKQMIDKLDDQRKKNDYITVTRYLKDVRSYVSNIAHESEEKRFVLEEINLMLSQVHDSETVNKNRMNETSDSDFRTAAMIDSMTEMCQEFIDEAVLQESIRTGLRKVKDKVTNRIVRFTLADREMSEKLNEKFNRYIGEYRENKKSTSYDKIVKDTINLSKMLKTLIMSTIVALLIPGGVQIKIVGAVLTILVRFVMDKRSEYKHKQAIMNDLKFELRMIQEKVRDAESKGDRKSKYKLMRIENQLERAIARIKYSLPKN